MLAYAFLPADPFPQTGKINLVFNKGEPLHFLFPASTFSYLCLKMKCVLYSSPRLVLFGFHPFPHIPPQRSFRPKFRNVVPMPGAWDHRLRFRFHPRVVPWRSGLFPAPAG